MAVKMLILTCNIIVCKNIKQNQNNNQKINKQNLTKITHKKAQQKTHTKKNAETYDNAIPIKKNK